MTSFPLERMGDLCEINIGRTPSRSVREYWGHGSPWLSIADMNQGRALSRTKEQITDLAVRDANMRIVPAGAVLLSFKLSIGKVGIATRPIYTNEAIAALPIVRPDRLCPEFLYWALQSMDLTVGQDRAAMGLTLNKAKLSELRVPLPPLLEQRRIAAILDQADALRAKRREALAQLDSLTPSIFIEMFGDPATNPMGWPTATLGDFIFSASDGPHVSPTYSSTGIPFLSTRHVRPGEISWSDLKYLTNADAEVQWKKCRPQRGDILYTKGGTTGFAAAVRTDTPFAVWVHVALLKPDPTKVETEWLESMLNAEFCYRQSQELTHGIANRDLGLKRMTKIRMYGPPLSLQREFVERKERVNSIRASGRLALTELDALFASLQHRAFAGQLS